MHTDADIPIQVQLATARERNEKLRRAKALRESNGINFYRPHWKQHLFHTATAVGRYSRTGNRFGKSDQAAAEDVAWCLGGRLWYREEFDILNGKREVAHHHPGGHAHPLVTQGIPDRPVKGLLIVVDWDMAKRIFTNREGGYENFGKLFKLIPTEALGKVHISRGGHVDQITIKRPREFGGGESTLSVDTIQSYKQSNLSAESADWDFIHVDEPCPEKLFKAHARGLMDRNGSYWFTCTPLDQPWINDRFTPPGRSTNIEEANDGLAFESKFIITGSIFDNPYRSEDGVAEFESSLTREEKACRLHGLPLAMAGMVYREFIYDMHVLCEVPRGWNDYHLPPKDYTIRFAWDFHGARVPQAVLFAATAPTGDVFIYDELFYQPLIGPNAELLREKIADRFVMAQLCDPRALIVNPVTGTADAWEAVAEHGIFLDAASKDLSTGISKVKEKLNERHVASKLPTIWFSPNLTETLYEFSHYVYNLETNKPIDKHDHMMENLYRLVLNGLDYVAPPSASDYAAITRRASVSHSADLERLLR